MGFGPGFATALRIAAGLCVVGSVIAFATIRTAEPVRTVSQPLAVSCLDPCVAEDRTDDSAADDRPEAA